MLIAREADEELAGELNVQGFYEAVKEIAKLAIHFVARMLCHLQM